MTQYSHQLVDRRDPLTAIGNDKLTVAEPFEQGVERGAAGRRIGPRMRLATKRKMLEPAVDEVRPIVIADHPFEKVIEGAIVHADAVAIDFAGGIVVHISAGLSALAAALVLGKRRGCVFWKDELKSLDKKGDGGGESKPSNIPYVILGAGLLWFGWFGFNGGSALAANDLAVSAIVTTNLAAAAAAVSWMVLDWLRKGKPSAVGISIGAVVGLVAITPAAGYVTVTAALIIGMSAGLISNLVASWRLARTRIDDTLDVFACHGVGGIWGSVVTGLFAAGAVNGVNGLLYGNAGQLFSQLLAVGVVAPFAFFGSYALLKVINVFSPLRVSPEEEDTGLDISQHGEEAYNLE